MLFVLKTFTYCGSLFQLVNFDEFDKTKFLICQPLHIEKTVELKGDAGKIILISDLFVYFCTI